MDGLKRRKTSTGKSESLEKSLFSETYKDNANKCFLEIFSPELSECIINFLRKRGYFVISYFDIHTDKRRILASTIRPSRFRNNQFRNRSNFISIEVKNGTPKNQPGYKNNILKSGGFFLKVHSLNDFYKQFESITGEML
jgi:hypothetical protein